MSASFVDIVRKLDATPAQLLVALGRAETEAAVLYAEPDESGIAGGCGCGCGAGIRTGDGFAYGGGELNGDGRGDAFLADVVSGTPIMRMMKGRAGHSLRAAATLLPSQADRDLALARLLAVGLVQHRIMVDFVELTPAGWHLLRIIGSAP